MAIDLIAKVIIPIIVLVMTYIIKPLIEQKTTKEQRENINAWVKIAVAAAEQMHEAGLITIPKKEFVIQYINKKGINITEADLEILIEAAVEELNRAKKKKTEQTE